MQEKVFRLRSFVRRDSRETPGQERAYADLWPRFGLDSTAGMVDSEQCFSNSADTCMEIGFGTGQSLLEFAKQNPDKNILAVETHKPGIGALFQGIETHGLTNLRVFHADVIDVLEKCIPNASLASVQIFFPDPWPKRRHHARRLIQAEFIKLLISKLKLQGTIHLATDWDDYAKHMQQVLSNEAQLRNLAGINQFATRSPYRPCISKFERRAIKEGRSIWELQFQKINALMD